MYYLRPNCLRMKTKLWLSASIFISDSSVTEAGHGWPLSHFPSRLIHSVQNLHCLFRLANLASHISHDISSAPERPGNRLRQILQSSEILLKKVRRHEKQKDFWTRFSIDLIIIDKYRSKIINAISWLNSMYYSKSKMSHEFMSIWRWNRQSAFAIGASDIPQWVESSQSMKEKVEKRRKI
jgi:hypothetical protein